MAEIRFPWFSELRFATSVFKLWVDFNKVESSTPHSCLDMIRFHSRAWHQQRGKKGDALTNNAPIKEPSNWDRNRYISNKSLPIRKICISHHGLILWTSFAFHLSWSSLGDWSYWRVESCWWVSKLNSDTFRVVCLFFFSFLNLAITIL